MSSTDPKPLPSLGFLTVVQYEQHGFLGGYLVLNTSGRPLEFHCTAPVKPNRAQEILYGPTLEPYLYGEQIGQALIAKSQLEPLVICTDLEPVLAVREYVSMPVTLVVQAEATPEASASAAGRVYRVDAAAERLKRPVFSLGSNRLSIAPAYADDEQRVTAALTPLSDPFDLSAPFERIRGAIDEAQRSGR